MTGSHELATITKVRLVPVIVCDDPTAADPLSAALVEGGLPIAEVTLRTPAAFDIIERMAKHSGLLVGAGTVLSAEQADRAIEAGAAFVVSPGLDEGVLSACQRRDVPVLPGVATASEVQQAVNLGLQNLKFFPAEAIGGTKLLKALSGPFPKVRFVPTGGIGPENLKDYLSLPAVLACGGSWMAPRDWIQRGEWERLTQAVREAVQLVAKSTKDSN